jgi:hypothetical protein
MKITSRVAAGLDANISSKPMHGGHNPLARHLVTFCSSSGELHFHHTHQIPRVAKP